MAEASAGRINEDAAGRPVVVEKAAQLPQVGPDSGQSPFDLRRLIEELAGLAMARGLANPDTAAKFLAPLLKYKPQFGTPGVGGKKSGYAVIFHGLPEDPMHRGPGEPVLRGAAAKVAKALAAKAAAQGTPGSQPTPGSQATLPAKKPMSELPPVLDGLSKTPLIDMSDVGTEFT